MKSDVLIIGGGVIGLAIAREMRKRGAMSVAVLERGLVGNEASSAAAGMLALQAETDRADSFFDFCTASNRMYPDYAASLQQETGIDIELDRTGTLFLAFTEDDSIELSRRHDWQKSVSLAVSRLSAAEVLALEAAINPDVREALLFPTDWQVENRKLIAALSAYAVTNGITLIENCETVALIRKDGRVEGVKTASAEHFGDTVILATGAWTSLIEDPAGELPNIKPIKGEIVTFGLERGLLRHVVYSPRGYVVPRSDGRIIAGATVEDVGYDKSITPAAEQSISRSAFEIAPKLRELEIKERWAGLRPYGPEGRPVIGRLPSAENLIVATGHYRNGILLAPATAKLVADIFESRESEFADAFSPNH